MCEHSLTCNEKIDLFLSLFAGLKNVYGTYDIRTGRVRQVKAVVDNDVIAAHLWSSRPYGVYLLVKDKTRAIVADFDTPDLAPVTKFSAHAQRLGIPVYIERSKSKGHHIWIFFDHPVPASKARLVVHYILNQIDLEATEVFPKRDRLDEKVSYGNFIYAPLFAPSVKNKRTIFVDPDIGYRPYKDQWQILYHLKKSSESKLDDIIEKRGLRITANRFLRTPRTDRTTRAASLPTCLQRMLSQGVSQYQRLACFRLAIGLKRVGLPFDATIGALDSWARKNTPADNKRIITESEIISQTRSAYSHDYRSIGCECPSVMPYCDPDCPVRKNRT